MRPLRIAFVTRRYWPLTSGPASATARLAAALAAEGHEPVVVTPRWGKDWPQRVTHHGTPVQRLPIPPRLLANWRYARRLSNWLRESAGRLDLVYVWGLKHDAAAAVATCRVLGLPVVLRPERAGLAGDCHWQLAARFGRGIKYRCMQAAAIVVPTPTLREEVIAAGFARDRIHAISAGVPLNPPPSEGDKALARERLAECHRAFQAPPPAPVALYFGRLDEGKGLEGLVRAWPSVVAALPEARLWLAGDGPLGPKLMALAAALDVRERVVVAGPFDCPADLLAAADVCLSPQPDSGTSQSLLEAMAAEKAIIASDIPDHRHFLDGGRCGMLVPPEDDRALAAGVSRLLRDGEQRRRLARAARERASSDFSLAQSLAAHIDLFRHVVENSADRNSQIAIRKSPSPT